MILNVPRMKNGYQEQYLKCFYGLTSDTVLLKTKEGWYSLF